MKELGLVVNYSTTSNVLAYRKHMGEQAFRNGVPFELLPKPIGEEPLFRRVTSSMVTGFEDEPMFCVNVK